MTDATFIEIFVSFYLIAVLVSDSDQKQTSLPAIYRNLPDNLIKALIIQLLSDRT